MIQLFLLDSRERQYVQGNTFFAPSCVLSKVDVFAINVWSCHFGSMVA